MAKQLARVAIDLPVADHKRLKTVASLMGLTMKDLVVISVGEYVQKKLSKVTRTALINAETTPKKEPKKGSSKKIERLI